MYLTDAVPHKFDPTAPDDPRRMPDMSFKSGEPMVVCLHIVETRCVCCVHTFSFCFWERTFIFIVTVTCDNCCIMGLQPCCLAFVFKAKCGRPCALMRITWLDLHLYCSSNRRCVCGGAFVHDLKIGYSPLHYNLKTRQSAPGGLNPFVLRLVQGWLRMHILSMTFIQ